MTDFDLLMMIGEAEDQYIMDSRRRPKKKPRKNTWVYALAACLALAVIGGTGAMFLNRGAGNAAPKASEPDMAVMENAAAEVPAEFGTEEDAVMEEAEAAAQPAAEPAVIEGATLLAGAVYPESLDYEDFDGRSAVWTENQTSDETKTALNSFAYAAAAKVLGGSPDSGCFSPLSLYQTLAVVTSGAGGETRDQLLSLLGQSDLDTLADQAGKLYRVNYQDNAVNILRIANSLWLDETDSLGAPVNYNMDWVIRASADYYADVYAAEFDNAETAEALGAWIAEKTGGMLHPSPETLGFDPNTVMAIVNTLWYKTQWAEKFDEASTDQADFTTDAGQTVTCDFMHRTELGGQAIVTDEYTKSSLYLERGRMIVVLPNEGVKVDDLLTEEKLWEIFENGDYEGADVVWSVPKFETGVTYRLEDVLRELGVTDAFDPDAADFSAMSSETPLYVGQVQQGTHIAVNEDGVEAAAYTMAAMMAGEAAPEELPTVEMNLNRPFIYLITADDGSALFIGVVRDPSA